jgi:zinc protease
MQSVLAEAAANGLPLDLVLASQRKELASAEFERNSISDLASRWSDAVAVEGRESPDQDIAALKNVTPEEVRRIAKDYLLRQSAIVAVLKPAPSGKAPATQGFGGSEQATVPPSSPVSLPPWAESALKTLSIPKPLVQPSDTMLPNGIRLIVLTEPSLWRVKSGTRPALKRRQVKTESMAFSTNYSTMAPFRAIELRFIRRWTILRLLNRAVISSRYGF